MATKIPITLTEFILLQIQGGTLLLNAPRAAEPVAFVMTYTEPEPLTLPELPVVAAAPVREEDNILELSEEGAQ